MRTMTTGSMVVYAAMDDAGASAPFPAPVGVGTAEERYLSIDEVCTYAGGERKPLHPTTIRYWIKSRGFPQAIHLSSNTARWRRSEIDAWIEAQRKA